MQVVQCDRAENHHSDQQTNVINKWCKQAGEPDFLTNFVSAIKGKQLLSGNIAFKLFAKFLRLIAQEVIIQDAPSNIQTEVAVFT